jgi:hypothetical protein
MGKSTYAGFVPKDDPMFSGGFEIFSHPESKPSSTNTAKSTTGETPQDGQYPTDYDLADQLAKEMEISRGQSSTKRK